MRRGIFQLCHLWRGIDAPSVFFMSMASEKCPTDRKKSYWALQAMVLKSGVRKKWSGLPKYLTLPLGAVLCQPGQYHLRSKGESCILVAAPLFWTRPTSEASPEALSRTFFDRLDIKFDAIDMINTLGTSIPRHSWHNWHILGILAEFSQGK